MSTNLQTIKWLVQEPMNVLFLLRFNSIVIISRVCTLATCVYHNKVIAMNGLLKLKMLGILMFKTLIKYFLSSVILRNELWISISRM